LPLIIASCKSFHAHQKASWHIAIIKEDGDFLISSSNLRSPSHGHILQASIFASHEKPFLLPHYVEAMACALAISMPTSLPRLCILGDPRVLNYIDMSTTEDFAITLSRSYSENEGSLDSCQSF
jgi:hypothetical protein